MSELTPDLRAHLETLRAKASFKGANLWDVLNAAGLLFTEDIRRNHRAHAVQAAMETLDRRSLPQLVGSAYKESQTTPKDVRNGVMRFLEGRVELEKRGGKT